MLRFRKISALFLSLLVLFGSTSFTINMHFCMDQIESIAFFQNAPDCEMITGAPSCGMEDHQQEGESKDTNGCCEDRIHLIEGQDEFKEVGSVSLPHIQFIAVLNAVFFYILTPSVLEDYDLRDYSPPIIERDILVLVQSFLI